MKKVLMLASLMIVTCFVSGCSNTLDGAGRDISGAGDKIQKTF